jgi:hypothetical protein
VTTIHSSVPTDANPHDNNGRLHFHPSVRHFCSALLSPAEGHRVSYAGDPLADFSTMAFLDRFSYKNPKLKQAAPDSDSRGAGALKRVLKRVCFVR